MVEPVRQFVPWGDLRTATLADAARYYLTSLATGKEKTVRAKRIDLDSLCHFLPDTKVGELSPVLLARYVENESKTKRPATVARRIATIKRFCKALNKMHPEWDDPSTDLKAPKTKAPTYKGLSRAEAVLLRACLCLEKRHRWHGFRAQFLFDLLINTGLRVSEALQLTEGQVDLEARKIRDVWGKGDRYDDINLNANLLREMRAYLKRRHVVISKTDPVYSADKSKRGKYPLFVSRAYGTYGDPDSYRWSIRSAQRAIKAATKLAGVDEELGHPHTLRHTFARRLLEATNNNVALVSKALRHSDLKITMRYLGHTEDELMEAMENL